MDVSQIRRTSDGSREKPRAYRIVPEVDRNSAFDLSDGRTPLAAFPFLSTEPAALAGNLRKKGLDAE